jgi:hypothetical protein
VAGTLVQQYREPRTVNYLRRTAELHQTSSNYWRDAIFRFCTALLKCRIIAIMRITLSLDDDVFREVKAYAESRDVATGKAVSELVRRGLHAPLQTRVVNGFHVVDLPSGSPAVTDEDVKKLQVELVLPLNSRT